MKIELSQKTKKIIKWLSIVSLFVFVTIWGDIYGPYQRTKIFVTITAQNAVKIYGVSSIDVTEQTQYDVYIVKPGETITELAKRYNTSIHALALLNEIDTRDFAIKGGQKILVPKKV